MKQKIKIVVLLWAFWMAFFVGFGCVVHVKHEHEFSGKIICRPIFGGYVCKLEKDKK